jgi:hypothetical protein
LGRFLHECWPHLGGERAWWCGLRVVINVGPTLVVIVTSMLVGAAVALAACATKAQIDDLIGFLSVQ